MKLVLEKRLANASPAPTVRFVAATLVVALLAVFAVSSIIVKRGAADEFRFAMSATGMESERQPGEKPEGRRSQRAVCVRA